MDDAKIVALSAVGTFMDVAQQGVHLENKKSVEMFGAKAETGQKFNVGGNSSPTDDDDSEEKRRRRRRSSSVQRVRRSPCKRSKSNPTSSTVPSNGDEINNAENGKLKRRTKRKALNDDDDNTSNDHNDNDNDNEKELQKESENIFKIIGKAFRKVFNNISEWFTGKNNDTVENM